MTAIDVLTVILILSAIATLGVVVWAATWLVRTLQPTRDLVDLLQERLPPILDRAESSLAAVEEELGRVDRIVSQVERVSDAIGSTERVANDLVGGVAGGLSRSGSRVAKTLASWVARRATKRF